MEDPSDLMFEVDQFVEGKDRFGELSIRSRSRGVICGHTNSLSDSTMISGKPPKSTSSCVAGIAFTNPWFVCLCVKFLKHSREITNTSGQSPLFLFSHSRSKTGMAGPNAAIFTYPRIPESARKHRIRGEDKPVVISYGKRSICDEFCLDPERDFAPVGPKLDLFDRIT